MSSVSIYMEALAIAKNGRTICNDNQNIPIPWVWQEHIKPRKPSSRRQGHRSNGEAKHPDVPDSHHSDAEEQIKIVQARTQNTIG